MAMKSTFIFIQTPIGEIYINVANICFVHALGQSCEIFFNGEGSNNKIFVNSPLEVIANQIRSVYE